MIKQMKPVMILILTILFISMIGCQQSIQCKYQPGQSERIKVTQQKKYESWVEMPGKDPAQRNSRTNKQEMTLQRQIESVATDGSALVTVTIESVQVTLDIDTQKSKSKHHYTSTAEKTDATWKGEPAVAGASYQIRIAPDTSLLEIIGLDEARAKLNIKSDTTGIVADLLSEASVRKIHERLFIKNYPGPDAMVPIPDAMIKAKAIQKTYTYQKDSKASTIRARSTGEPVYTLPEGFDKPLAPTNPGQTMILSISEMDELIVTGSGTFDLDTGTATNEENNIKCTLLITDESFSGKVGKAGKSSGGIMFTVIEIHDAFEKLP